ncbi:MAG: DUF6142 family protein [Lachnospiraceae bacterium]|nr:DUF6142 family protein [Lachnospiraceae bacterium]
MAWKSRRRKVQNEDSLKLTAKKHPKKGIISTILAVLSLVVFIIACVISSNASGGAPIAIGYLGFSSLVISVVGVILAWMSLREPDIRVVFPSIGGMVNILLTFFYIVVYIWGFNI